MPNPDNVVTQSTAGRPRLGIRQITPQDAERLFSIYSDARTNTFNPAGPMGHVGEAVAMIERWSQNWVEHGFGPWAINLTEASEQIVGFGGLSYATFGTEKRINLGYRFAADTWGQGLASEFARTAIAHGLETLKLKEIFAKVRPEHTASRRVLEKVGLKEFASLDDVPGAAASIVYRIGRSS